MLTVTHTSLASTSELRIVGQGWPAVLANLKALLETGEERAAQMAKNG